MTSKRVARDCQLQLSFFFSLANKPCTDSNLVQNGADRILIPSTYVERSLTNMPPMPTSLNSDIRTSMPLTLHTKPMTKTDWINLGVNRNHTTFVCIWESTIAKGCHLSWSARSPNDALSNEVLLCILICISTYRINNGSPHIYSPFNNYPPQHESLRHCHSYRLQ